MPDDDSRATRLSHLNPAGSESDDDVERSTERHPDGFPATDSSGPSGGPPIDQAPGHRARRSRYSPHQPWGRLARRWVPEPLRDSRVDPGKRGALLLTVVAAIAALVAAVGVWRDQPVPRPVQSVALSAVTDTSAVGAVTRAGKISGSFSTAASTVAARDTATGSTSASSPGGAIVVSVTGAVRHPGLVRLTAGARVADAIDKAGGATGAANLTGLNLAAKLADGASVVVGDAGSGSGDSGSSVSSDGDEGAVVGSSAPKTGASKKVDLNTTDVAGLDALPGVGPVTAAGIVAWREKNGRFTSVEQLQEIPGIGPAKFAALSPLVTV